MDGPCFSDDWQTTLQLTDTWLVWHTCSHSKSTSLSLSSICLSAYLSIIDLTVCLSFSVYLSMTVSVCLLKKNPSPSSWVCMSLWKPLLYVFGGPCLLIGRVKFVFVCCTDRPCLSFVIIGLLASLIEVPCLYLSRTPLTHKYSWFYRSVSK